MEAMKTYWKIFLFTALTALAIFLQGCMNAAVTSAQVVYDRHNLQKSLNDHYITMVAYKKIYNQTNRFKDTNVAFATFNGVLIMTGQVPTQQQRIEIEKIVRQIPDTDRVYNLTTLSQASSTLTEVSDSWITAKIKAKLIAMNDVDPSQIKVVTENGTVYLMGIVPPDQADTA